MNSNYLTIPIFAAVIGFGGFLYRWRFPNGATGAKVIGRPRVDME